MKPPRWGGFFLSLRAQVMCIVISFAAPCVRVVGKDFANR
jgi:hypothetical protein